MNKLDMEWEKRNLREDGEKTTRGIRVILGIVSGKKKKIWEVWLDIMILNYSNNA